MSAELLTKEAWKAYCEKEIAKLTPLLASYGITLSTAQPHISGERFLMQAITTSSGKKLILLGEDAGGKVVVKASNNPNGIGELIHERNCRDVLNKLDFAAEIFNTPTEVAFIEKDGYVISVQRYIDQPKNFLERTIEEQFMLALHAFKDQESAHAATFKHRKAIAKVFGIRNKMTYLDAFQKFTKEVPVYLTDRTDIHQLLSRAAEILTERQHVIEQYCGFLTHTDLVPHNIRITEDKTIYLLDYSSLTFGNKHEGWARFINFMALYNPPLKRALEQYIQDNRSKEERESLHLMRIYRLGEIIYYYSRTLEKSEGDLLQLNSARVDFWSKVLKHTLDNEDVPDSVIEDYTTLRDSLRSEDEKKRQQNLH